MPLTRRAILSGAATGAAALAMPAFRADAIGRAREARRSVAGTPSETVASDETYPPVAVLRRGSEVPVER